MRKIIYSFIIAALFSSQAFAVLPTIFGTYPSGNVPASLLDNNFTFLEKQGVQALTTSGTSNAYISTPADAWVTGYSQYVGRALTIIPNFTNTSSSTINVSGLGAASLYKNVVGTQTALDAGDMQQGIPSIVICDGTGFLLINPTSLSSAPLNSPAFTGTPTAPTASTNTSTTQLATTAFANPPSTLATIGTATFPSGLIIKWGVTATGNVVNGTITYATAFPNGIFTVLATINEGTGGSAVSRFVGVGSLSTSSFAWESSSSSVNTKLDWFAIGD